MGWFHRAFGFSSQPAVEAISRVAEPIYNVATQSVGDLAGAITGSDKLKNFLQPPSWDEWGKPGEALYNEVNQANAYLPTKTLRQYAPAIEGAVLSAFNPLAGAAFNTAYNAGSMQANQKGMDWGEVGKNAAINFGTAAASMAADKLASNAKTAQAAKNYTPSTGPMHEGFELSKYGTNAPAVGSNFGSGIPSTLATEASSLPGFNSSVAAARAMKSAPQGQSTLARVGDTAYNAAVKGAPDLANQALTSTLAPKTQAISGMGTGSDILQGEGYTPSGSDLFNAFGGSAVNSKDLISEEQFRQMQQGLGINAGMQTNMARDTFLPTGQTEPDPNTPYSGTISDIGKSYAQAGVDLTNQVNTENYNRYNALLYDKLLAANPTNMNQGVFQGWLKDPTTVPQNIAPYFKPAPQLIGF